jgi:glutaminyl-peptide cyclotransferase
MQFAVARKPSDPAKVSPAVSLPAGRFTHAARWRRTLLVLVALGAGTGLGWLALHFASAGRVATWQYRIVRDFPHDRSAYTQGLVFHEGWLYEGTGRYGESDLRKVELESGRVMQRVPLAPRYFGEGITIWQDRIFQLTWRERTAFEYDLETLQPTGRTFRYSGEGWGLTHDGKHLILSDGTSVLRFLDPETWQVVRRITVRDGRQRILNLNELEYIEGEIFANIWKQDVLVRISPRTGAVLGWVDMRGLWPLEERRDDDQVLNGIAYDPPTGRIFVTGKNWPKLFEIELVPAER